MRSLLRASMLTTLAGASALAFGQESANVTSETRAIFAAYAEQILDESGYTAMWQAEKSPDYAEDATFTDMTNISQPIVGRDAIGSMLAMFYGGAFGDGHYKDSTWIADGHKVLNEFTFVGTHTGDLNGIPPTGRAVELHMMSIYHVEDGYIRWARLYYDSATLLRQLGLMP